MNSFFIGSDGKYYRKGTLAHYLDKRIVSRGEPTLEDLPVTLNPLQFLLENVFRDRLSFVVVDKKCCQDFIDTPFLTDILKTCTETGNLNVFYMKLESLEDTIDRTLVSDNYNVIPAIASATETMGSKSESITITRI